MISIESIVIKNNSFYFIIYDKINYATFYQKIVISKNILHIFYFKFFNIKYTNDC